MDCRFCQGSSVLWRRPRGKPAYTYCTECKRRNCEAHTARSLPHGENECDRAQLRFNL